MRYGGESWSESSGERGRSGGGYGNVTRASGKKSGGTVGGRGERREIGGEGFEGGGRERGEGSEGGLGRTSLFCWLERKRLR